MTASTSTPPAVAAAAANPGILPGFGGVFRGGHRVAPRVASVDHADREHVVHDPYRDERMDPGHPCAD